MKKFTFLLLLPLLLCGCAAIVGSNEETVNIESQPTNAFFIISDQRGAIIKTGTTPQAVTLKKSDGSYFGKREYTLTVKQEGYYSLIVPLETRLSHWYTLGNIIFLGVPGWLVVDPFFGGMYTLKSDAISAVLRPCPPGPFNYMCT
jgi:hypothetical protein